ncbi:hypothetical protein DFH08DRAFT_717822, partial [Mycena albidolilacea]
RSRCSVVLQMRTGQIGLNAYLHRFNLAPSSHCPLCAVPETVPHYLFLCRAFRRQCFELILELGTTRLTPRLLLGVKADHKSVLTFVPSTNRLPRHLL